MNRTFKNLVGQTAGDTQPEISIRRLIGGHATEIRNSSQGISLKEICRIGLGATRMLKKAVQQDRSEQEAETYFLLVRRRL